MYITSDLFGAGSDANYAPFDTATSTTTSTWNTMTDSQTAALGKRKRRMDMDDPAEGPSSIHTSLQRPTHSAGKMMHKRQALGHTLPIHTPGPATYLVPESRPLKQLKRMTPKKIPTMFKSTSHLMDVEVDNPIPSSICNSHSSSAPDLRPCHICHTAIKRRTDLENFQECKRCNEHTCFICVRQCADGCGEKICRKCCVEVGEEGDTLCLGCYARNDNF